MSDSEMHAVAPAATNNAPNASPSKEPDSEAKVSAFVDLGPTIYTVISFTILVLFVVGTAVPWTAKQTKNEKTMYTLWTASYENTTQYVLTQSVRDFTCPDQISYFRAAESFAIISIFFALAMTIVGFLARFEIVSLKIGVVLAIAAFAASIVCWGTGLRTFYLSFCNVPSFYDQRFNIGAGAALFVSGWVLSFFAIVTAIISPKVPQIVPDALLNTFASSVFLVLAFPAFCFSVIATPISLFYIWTAANRKIEVSSWNIFTFINNNQVAKIAWSDLNCGQIGSTSKFSASFAIITIITSLIAVVTGYLYYRGGPRKNAILAALLAFFTGLLKFAADTSLFYRRFCDSYSLEAQGYQMTAGYALSAAVWVLFFVAVVILLVISISQYFAKGETTVNWASVVFLVGILISLVFVILGAALPVIELSEDTNWVKYFWWSFQFSLGTNVYTRTQDYPCTELKDRMLAGGSLDIVAIGLVALAAVCAVGQFFNSVLRKPSAVLGFLATLPMLVTWAIGVAVYWGNFCGTTPYNSNYRISSGLGLVIAAWCITLVISLLQYFVQ